MGFGYHQFPELKKEFFLGIKFNTKIISKTQINFDKGVTKVLFQGNT